MLFTILIRAFLILLISNTVIYLCWSFLKALILFAYHKSNPKKAACTINVNKKMNFSPLIALISASFAGGYITIWCFKQIADVIPAHWLYSPFVFIMLITYIAYFVFLMKFKKKDIRAFKSNVISAIPVLLSQVITGCFTIVYSHLLIQEIQLSKEILPFQATDFYPIIIGMLGIGALGSVIVNSFQKRV